MAEQGFSMEALQRMMLQMQENIKEITWELQEKLEGKLTAVEETTQNLQNKIDAKLTVI